MNCYFHQNEGSVVACGKCGVALCRECETNAFFRTHDGTGQAMCNRCSLQEAEESLADIEARMIFDKWILIISGVLIAIAFVIKEVKSISAGYSMAIFGISLFLAGVTLSLREAGRQKSTKEQVSEALAEHEAPFLMMVLKFAFTVAFAPISFVIVLISYIINKPKNKKEIEKFKAIKAEIGEIKLA